MKIKNLLFGPLTLHLLDGTGLHLGSRESRQTPAELISEEIRLVAKRELIKLVDAAIDTTEPAIGSETAEIDSKKGKTR